MPRFYFIFALALGLFPSNPVQAQGTTPSKVGSQQNSQPAPKMDEATVWKKMIGTWRPGAGEVAGKPMPEQMKTIRLAIAAEKTYVVDFGGLKDTGTIAVDLSSALMQMKLTGTEGPNKDKVIPAIFKFDGEKLVVCYDLQGEKSPSEFKSPDGSTIVIFNYERVKEEAPAK